MYITQVKPGDLLGFIGETGRLADFYTGVATTPFATATTKLTWPENGVSVHHHEFYLNAHVATFSEMEVSDNKYISICITKV